MQKTDQDRDIQYLKNNPSPHKYSPTFVGRELAKDGIKYSMASKAHPRACKYPPIYPKVDLFCDLFDLVIEKK